MTIDTFRLLAPLGQMTHALVRGTYLASRWQEEGRVMLYYLPDGPSGFFVEIGQDAHQGRAVVVRSFTSAEPLEDYVYGVRLPEW